MYEETVGTAGVSVLLLISTAEECLLHWVPLLKCIM